MARSIQKKGTLIWLSEADLFPPDGDASVRYGLKPIGLEVACDMSDAAANKGDAAKVAVFIDKCLDAWEGVEIDGQPAPCDHDCKMQLDIDVAMALCKYFMERRAAEEAARQASFRPA